MATRLREFYDRKQTAGEKIRAFAYDLQEKLRRLKRRDPDRFRDPDTALREQFVLGLYDNSTQRDKTTSKDIAYTQTFNAL